MISDDVHNRYSRFRLSLCHATCFLMLYSCQNITAQNFIHIVSLEQVSESSLYLLPRNKGFHEWISQLFQFWITGNIDTLDVRPKSKGIDTREELLKFYEEHYSSNLMCLVVYGKGKFIFDKSFYLSMHLFLDCYWERPFM